MEAILIETEQRLLDRAFLYEDPESFRSGVHEAVEALKVAANRARLERAPARGEDMIDLVSFG